MKTMSPVCDEKELTAYVGVVMKLEIHGIELVARKIARNDVGMKVLDRMWHRAYSTVARNSG
jgi:hypothetical protein